MRFGVTIVAAALGLGSWGMATVAQACGGTFCDNAATPVDQTGENILFVQGDGFVEAHIQVQYDPDAGAERFAWVVPVMELPELSIGSNSFFDALATGTTPSYGFGRNDQLCGEDACGEQDPGGGGIRLDAGGNGGTDVPSVVTHEIVGAFEMFVLEGGTTEGVMAWLGGNGFVQDPAAAPILDEYLADGFRFVAFKLAPGAGAREIHPVVLRYPGSEACVPIRLTRIAAVDDMVLRTYFLGESRAVPTNYLHVEPNLLKLDWLDRGANYRELVTMAVDQAGGHAWITEFSGDAATVDLSRIVEADWWDINTLAAVDPIDGVLWLRNRNLVDCSGGDACTWANPLLPGLLATHLPLPAEVDLDAVFACPECYADVLSTTTWDGAAFADAVVEQIIEPAEHARTLLETWPTLTRMVTTLSPHEMTKDPVFGQNPDLPGVTRQGQVGTRNGFCDGAASFELPDGRLVALPDGGVDWPDIGGRRMPWVKRVEQLVDRGAPQEITDRTLEIDDLLSAFNERHAVRQPVAPECGGSGGSDAGGSDESGSVPPFGDGADAMAPTATRTSGCGCDAGGRDANRMWLFGALVLGASGVRRRGGLRGG